MRARGPFCGTGKTDYADFPTSINFGLESLFVSTRGQNKKNREIWMADIEGSSDERVEGRTSFEPYSAFELPADLRQLHGRYDVEATARRLRNFRYAEEWMMLTMGGWLATIPELPVKTGLGKIIWETAQAADSMGSRLPELRCGRKSVAQSETSNRAFADFVQEIADPEAAELSIEKLVGIFEVLKPHLVDVYEATIRETDAIADAPTIELLDAVIRKARRHIEWGRDVLDGLCQSDEDRQRRERCKRKLQRRLTESSGVTGELAPSA